MKSKLLATKFHIPPIRATEINRQHLLKKLNAGLNENRKLTLVSAPVGYGKTTLISEWAHSLPDDIKLTWLSLNQVDNELERFLHYWLAAFQRIETTIGENLLPYLNLPQLPPLQNLLEELINQLAELPYPALLVLDDYHLITNQQIHDLLEAFLEHIPAHIHLVIITRQDPPLPLARLRARAQMTEIRAHDLRFLPEEAQQFLKSSMQLELSKETFKILEERTEGWPVGYHLAGLALQNPNNAQSFIEDFRGSHRFVLDYLAEEVIAQQEEESRFFLIQTSILEYFNANLCEALTNKTDAQSLITKLEEANLFIVPLDNERGWYRYHNLFSDYLRTLLTKSERTTLYKKASSWHQNNNLIIEAVQYALASEDSDFSTTVIEHAVNQDEIWVEGNIAILSSWLDALPPQALQSRPQLSLDASHIFYLAGRFEQAEKCIQQAEQALIPMPPSDEKEQMQALAALYRGSIAAVHGDINQTEEKINFALIHLPQDNHLAQARAYFSLGVIYEITEQSQRAAQNYLQASQQAQKSGILSLAIHALCSAAQIQIAHGQLQLAEQSCHTAIQYANNEPIAPLGLAKTILGAIALERNELSTAKQLLQEGIALSRQGGLIDDIVLGLSFLAPLEAYLGNINDAFATSQEAHTLLNYFGVERMSRLANAYLARLQLFTGQTQAAVQWAANYQTMRPTTSYPFAELTLARVLLATSKLDPIPSILHPLLEKAENTGQIRSQIEIMLLLGLYFQAKNDLQSAQDWLSKALQMAQPAGYMRLFVDESTTLSKLLPKLHSSAPQIVDALLDTLEVNEEMPPQLAELPDPLSEQELRVLRLVVAGKSNREIAEELVISIGTAKWHVHNILQKLGANNRPQAIARALELGLC